MHQVRGMERLVHVNSIGKVSDRNNIVENRNEQIRFKLNNGDSTILIKYLDVEVKTDYKIEEYAV